MQLDQPEKGFSFSKEGPLDMRMDPTASLTAREIVNEWSEEDLGNIFREYGEERNWRRIAKAIVTARKKTAFETTKQLADVVAANSGGKPHKRLHPATLIFQALRICVNGELESIKKALPKAVDYLRSGGRIAMISFHSLEDRIVKHLFKGWSFSSKREEKKEGWSRPILKLLTTKPIKAAFDEVAANPRARSALLRLAEKQ